MTLLVLYILFQYPYVPSQPGLLLTVGMEQATHCRLRYCANASQLALRLPKQDSKSAHNYLNHCLIVTSAVLGHVHCRWGADERMARDARWVAAPMEKAMV